MCVCVRDRAETDTRSERSDRAYFIHAFKYMNSAMFGRACGRCRRRGRRRMRERTVRAAYTQSGWTQLPVYLVHTIRALKRVSPGVLFSFRAQAGHHAHARVRTHASITLSFAVCCSTAHFMRAFHNTHTCAACPRRRWASIWRWHIFSKQSTAVAATLSAHRMGNADPINKFRSGNIQIRTHTQRIQTVFSGVSC